jgi:tetratricopeptide (TPR) repeat protein
MHPSLLILLVGLLYILGFGALSFARRQGLSTRFAIEGLIVTAVCAVLVLGSVSIHPVLFLLVLYLVTMRVRLLVDLGNWFTSRKQHDRALVLFRLALRLRPDAVSRQIVLINRGVTQLRVGQPEAAYFTLKAVLLGEEVKTAARYLAAGYYNMGVACQRTSRKQEAARHFRRTIEILPGSIYAHAASQALKRDDSSSNRHKGS